MAESIFPMAAGVVWLKNYPSDDNCDHGVKVAHYRRRFFQETVQQELLGKKEKSIVNAPENKVPAGTMPKTCKGPYHKNVTDMLSCRNTVSAKGNINIITEPASK